MTLRGNLLLIVFLIPVTIVVFGQDTIIKIPVSVDRYSKYVAQLESGDLNVDFTDFRNSFLESKQSHKVYGKYDSLKKLLFTAAENRNFKEVLMLSKAMLSIDYTSLYAHMFLQKTYLIMGDSLNQKKYHDIEFGLINSIINSGDGKTCETGWHVIKIEEEYFMIRVVLDAEFLQQSLIPSKKNSCDKMLVKTEKEGKEIYYFEINKIIEQEMKTFR